MEISDKKEEFNLTAENYHSPEARKHYLGASMFKEFMKCEVMGLAKVNGTIEDKKTTALLVGSYIDAYFSGELDQFKDENPQIFKRDGTLLKDFEQAEEIIKFIEQDELLMKYLNGEHQRIMTGEIAGVPFKIKMDSYHKGKLIVDQKVMKDMEDVWDDNDHRYKDFIEAYGYDIQGAIYQTIEAQNQEGDECKPLPFVLAVATKEDYPNKELIEIDQYYLDKALELVTAKAPRFWDIIQGKIAPVGCGKCAACRQNKKLTGVKSYNRLFKEKEE